MEPGSLDQGPEGGAGRLMLISEGGTVRCLFGCGQTGWTPEPLGGSYPQRMLPVLGGNPSSLNYKLGFWALVP